MNSLKSSTARRPLARVAMLGSLAVLTLGGAQACSSSGPAALADRVTGSDAAQSRAQHTDRTTASGVEPAGGVAAEQDTATREPSIIATATVGLESGNVTTARQDVQRLVDRVKGHVSESSTEADQDGTPHHARMVLRVPADSFDDVLNALEDVATQTSASTQSSDVTTEVIDVESRVATQKASVARIRQLLARATSMKDIAWLESQLSDRQATLDSATQQQAYLADQTSLSTITVDITDPSRHEDADPDRSGFLGGLHRGWDAFTASAAGLVTALGAALPFGVVVGLLVWLARPLWRRRRRATSGVGVRPGRPTRPARTP